MKKTITLLFSIITGITIAGSGPAYIDCQSKSKRTQINLTLNDLYSLAYSKLKIDNDSLVLYEPDNHWVIFSKNDSVLTINATYKVKVQNSQEAYMEFWALPNSFNYKVNERHHLEGTFNAKIKFTDPRKGKNNWTPTIQLGCKVKYSI